MSSRTHMLGSPRLGGKGEKGRRGAILVLTALFMVFLIGLLAFSVDLGYMMTVRAELKRATDAAALAGAAAAAAGLAATAPSLIWPSSAPTDPRGGCRSPISCSNHRWWWVGAAWS